MKRQFVQRKAMNAYKADVAATFDGAALRAAIDVAIGPTDGVQAFELAFARAVTQWQQDESANAARIDVAQRYAAWAAHTAAGKSAHRGGVLFRAPRKLDLYKLVPAETVKVNDDVQALQIAAAHGLRRRDGFALTDPGTDLVGALDQAHYCIWCHEQGKDSCARGLFEKRAAAPDGAAADAATPMNPFKKSVFGVTLAGCPLEERISEFHKLRAEGWPIGALAMICVDNPMAAATGHRICNDCMFEAWVGEEPFRRGVRQYLDRHRYGSATVTDFLDALGAASGKPVAPAFATFLDQNGVPEVTVALACTKGGAHLALAQRRYTAQEANATAQRWQIPVCARYASGDASRTECTLLAEREGSLDLGSGCPAFVFANAGGRGYYVPAYSPGMLARLARHRGALTPSEYASVLYDLRPLVRAGAVSSAAAFDWIRAGARSSDRHVMLAAIELATFVRDELVPDESRQRFADFVRREFGPRARALGFVPRRGERDDDQLLRRSLLGFVGPEDPALAAEARRLARAWIVDRSAVDAGLADAVLLVAARTGDATLLDAMQDEMRKTANRLDRRNLLIALFSFADPALARRGLSLLLDPQVDIRDAMTALGSAAARTPPTRVTHAFIAEHFDALAARVDADAPGGWSGYAETLCSAADRASVEAFWQPRIGIYATAERNLAQTLEAIDACTRLRERERGNVAALLAVTGSSAARSQ